MSPPPPSNGRRAHLGGSRGRLMFPSVLQQLPCLRLPPPRHSACAQRPLRGTNSPWAPALSSVGVPGKGECQGSRLPAPQLRPSASENALKRRQLRAWKTPGPGRRSRCFPGSPERRPPRPSPVRIQCHPYPVLYSLRKGANNTLTGSLCFVIQSCRAGTRHRVLHTVGAM